MLSTRKSRRLSLLAVAPLVTACAAVKELASPSTVPPPPESCPGYVWREPSERRIPVVKGDPQYPVNAGKAGIEGWVCVVFTITADGHVRDPMVTASAPKGYFEDATLRAMRNWRYQKAAADTPGAAAVQHFKQPTPPPPPTAYLGAFTINATDLKPTVIKDCDPVAPDDAESALNSTAAEFESRFDMTCKQQADNQSYMCVDQARGTIARIRIWKAEAGCRRYPVQFAHDAKTLLNRQAAPPMPNAVPPIPEGVPPMPKGPCPGGNASPVRRTPVQRAMPSMPSRAREERIQGWACVVFTVTADGSVRDAKVTASAPEGYFEEAALDATRQWTYQPAQSDSPGLSALLTFKLDR